MQKIKEEKARPVPKFPLIFFFFLQKQHVPLIMDAARDLKNVAMVKPLSHLHSTPFTLFIPQHTPHSFCTHCVTHSSPPIQHPSHCSSRSIILLILSALIALPILLHPFNTHHIVQLAKTSTLILHSSLYPFFSIHSAPITLFTSQYHPPYSFCTHCVTHSSPSI